MSYEEGEVDGRRSRHRLYLCSYSTRKKPTVEHLLEVMRVF